MIFIYRWSLGRVRLYIVLLLWDCVCKILLHVHAYMYVFRNSNGSPHNAMFYTAHGVPHNAYLITFKQSHLHIQCPWASCPHAFTKDASAASLWCHLVVNALISHLLVNHWSDWMAVDLLLFLLSHGNMSDTSLIRRRIHNVYAL